MHEALGLASNITEMGVELQACAFKACNSSRDRRGRSSEPSSCTVLAAFLLLRKSSLTENNLGEKGLISVYTSRFSSSLRKVRAGSQAGHEMETTEEPEEHTGKLWRKALSCQGSLWLDTETGPVACLACSDTGEGPVWLCENSKARIAQCVCLNVPHTRLYVNMSTYLHARVKLTHHHSRTRGRHINTYKLRGRSVCQDL